MYVIDRRLRVGASEREVKRNCTVDAFVARFVAVKRSIARLYRKGRACIGEFRMHFLPDLSTTVSRVSEAAAAPRPASPG